MQIGVKNYSEHKQYIRKIYILSIVFYKSDTFFLIAKNSDFIVSLVIIIIILQFQPFNQDNDITFDDEEFMVNTRKYRFLFVVLSNFYFENKKKQII